MTFTIIKNGIDALRDKIADELTAELEAQGCRQNTGSGHINFILNLTRFDAAKAVHRRAQNEFVVSLAVLHQPVDDLRYLCYNALIQTLSNLVVCIVPRDIEPPVIYCMTPELGFYHFPYAPRPLFDNILPIIGARFMINNLISTDLPRAYHRTAITEQVRHYGAELDKLGVLPSPFPLNEVLSPENIEHVYKLFNIKGLSYGNLSAREHIPEIGPNTFWMTARGVDKAHLEGVGQDMLLVKGYDLKHEVVLVSLPPEHDPRIRVSVDAIEHALLYETFPEIGAIVHVHAWFRDPIPATRQNYPCGTYDLAREVVAIFKITANPGQAVIGLKNHGLTITGTDLDDIFSRIKGKLLKEVPMMT